MVSCTGSHPAELARCASFCLNWALTRVRQFKIITHRDNRIMQHLLDKNGFTYCGIIYLDDGTERLAYQNSLDNQILL